MKHSKGKIGLLCVAFSILLTACTKQETVSEMEPETAVLREETQVETVTEPETETEKMPAAKAGNRTEEDTGNAETEEEKTEKKGETEELLSTEAETEEVEESKKLEYTVTQVEEVSMYAASAVNVRKGPSTDFERVGALKAGQEVTVTGEASTGWYEIAYGEEKAFVSDKYLQSEPIPEEQVQAASSNIAGTVDTTNVILIGDSRTAEMKNCVGENSCVWIADFSKGVSWFVSDAVPAAEPYIGQGTKVIINLGANDPEKIDTYIYTMNEVCSDWISRGAAVYYATVGPCNENPYHTNDEAATFNASLQNGVTAGVQWIDLYSYLVNNGFATREGDGFHYDTATYAGIYSYYMSCIR